MNLKLTCFKYAVAAYARLQKLKKKKAILLICNNQTMEEHIIDYYNQICEMEHVELYLYYENYTYTQEFIDQRKEQLCQGRNIHNIRHPSLVMLYPWALVVSADRELPKAVFHHTIGNSTKFPLHKNATRGCALEQDVEASDSKTFLKTLYINHGIHMISYDKGENLYAYDPKIKSGNGEKEGNLFTAYLEPNADYCECIRQQYPQLKLYHAGYKYSDRILECQKKRQEYRRQFNIKDNETFVMAFATWNTQCLFRVCGEDFIHQAKALMKEDFVFGLSIHPREYEKYSEELEPLGPYIDQQEQFGFIIRNPKEDYIPYMVAADVVISDYSSMCEIAALLKKNLILSEFSTETIWKQSHLNQLMKVTPVFQTGDNLRERIEQAQQNQQQKAVYDRYEKNLLLPYGEYGSRVRKITRELVFEEQDG